MATEDVNTSQDTEMAECDGEKVVTMMDVLQEQQDFEEDANAVLGASDDKNCTYSKGYIKRQAVYACLTCCTEAKTDPTKRAGVCLACSLNCHENHELVELYTKRNFRCDCGDPKFNSNPCQFIADKKDVNEENNYNQNFSGLYCICHRPYPDPEATEEDEMIQCIICEDWLHSSHLEATLPANDQYSEMICKACMDKNEFLHDYSDLAVVVESVDILTVNGGLNNGILENDKFCVSTSNSVSEKALEKEIEEKRSDIDMPEENKSELESDDKALKNEDSEKNSPQNEDNIHENTNKNKPEEDNLTQTNDVPMEVQDTETSDLKTGEKKNDESETIPSALVESNDNTRSVEALVNSEIEATILEENVSDSVENTSQKLESSGTEIDKLVTETIEKLDSGENLCESGNADNNKTLVVETSTENNDETGVITSTVEHSDKTENNTKEVLEETSPEASRIDANETPSVATESDTPENIDREQTPGSQFKELETTSHITEENDDLKKNTDIVPDTTTEDITVEPTDKIDTDDEMRQENELLNEREETIENEEKSDVVDSSVNKPDPATEELITDTVEESIDKENVVENKDISGLNDSTGQPNETTEYMETDQESTDKEHNITENEPSKPNSPEAKPDQSTEEMKTDAIQKSTDREDNLTEKQEISDTSDLTENKQDEDLTVKVTDKESTKKDGDVENKETIENSNMEATDESLKNLEPSINKKLSTEDEESTSKMTDGSLKDLDPSINKINLSTQEEDSTSKTTDGSLKDLEPSINKRKLSTEDEESTSKMTDGSLKDLEPSINKINLSTQEEDSTSKTTDGSLKDLEPSINKRKLSTEDEESTSKKQKIIEKECTRPKNVKKIFKGATFWPMHFRQKLCTCNECLSMYKDLSVLFLIDPEDTVMAYETLGKEKFNGAPSQYEKGLQALSSLDRIQQINALTEYNRMRDKLLDFLKSFKEKKEIVKEEDIKAFFADMKPKREPDGVYFCR